MFSMAKLLREESGEYSDSYGMNSKQSHDLLPGNSQIFG